MDYLSIFNIKRYIAIFAIMAIIAPLGCTSPADVDANRTIVVRGDKDKINVKFEPGELDFGFVSFNSSESLPFYVENLSNDSVTIIDIDFKNASSPFSLDPQGLPITLAPSGTQNARVRLGCNFAATKTGEFTNNLQINKQESPALFVKAIAPTVEVLDADFSSVSIGSGPIKTFKIKNHGDKTAIVKNYYEVDPENVFAPYIPLLPKEIPAGGEIGFAIEFKPREVKPYSGLIEFEIEADGPVDAVCSISGAGI